MDKYIKQFKTLINPRLAKNETNDINAKEKQQIIMTVHLLFLRLRSPKSPLPALPIEIIHNHILPWIIEYHFTFIYHTSPIFLAEKDLRSVDEKYHAETLITGITSDGMNETNHNKCLKHLYYIFGAIFGLAPHKIKLTASLSEDVYIDLKKLFMYLRTNRLCNRVIIYIVPNETICRRF